MHINCHYALGLVIASIFHHFFSFTLIEFSFIVLCSFIMDFDIFFSKYAKDHNHRMLITHSILPGIILIIIGMILSGIFMIIGGMAYCMHSLIDTFDWGTNFTGFSKKPLGLKLLISKEELDNLEEILAGYKINKSFFDMRYYSKRGILITEVILAVLMILTVSFLALEYVWMILLYIPFLLFHLLGYSHLKKVENNP